jgi:hypothetical protein
VAETPSKKTTDFEIPYAAGADAPPDVPKLSEKVAERINAILKSLKGDATLATNGTVSLTAAAKERFPQLKTAGTHMVAQGTATVAWGGSSQFSAPFTVEHGLGVKPLEILLGAGIAPGPGDYVIANYNEVTTTKFVIVCYAPQGNPTAGSSSVSWYATT